MRTLCALSAIVALTAGAASAATATAHKQHRHKPSAHAHCHLSNVFGQLIGADEFGNGGTPTYSLTIACAGKGSHPARFKQFTVTSNKRIQAPESGRSVPSGPCTITGPFTYSCTLSTKGAGRSAATADTRFTSPDGCRPTPWSGTAEVQVVDRGRHKTLTLPFTATQCYSVGLP